jgi:hypothetical protein
MMPQVTFQIGWFDFQSNEGKAMRDVFRSHTDAAMKSVTKYSDYSAAYVDIAFLAAESIYVVSIPSESGFVIPAGFALMSRNKARILMLFTLPAGKNNMLVSRLVGHIKLDVAHECRLDRLECDTHGYSWISGPCESHNFIKDSQTLSRTNVLHFNIKPVVQLPSILDVSKLSNEDILNETSVEHAPVSLDEFSQPNLSDFGPITKLFFTACLEQKIFLVEDCKLLRVDVRCSMLRPEQSMIQCPVAVSQNPTGAHCDWMETDEAGYFVNGKETDTIVLMSIGKPGTKIYTEKFGVAITTQDWCKVWRETEFDKAIKGSFIETQDAVPIVMDNTTLHSAQFLQPQEKPVARMMIRITKFAKSRMHLVPLKKSKGVSQIYTPIEVM